MEKGKGTFRLNLTEDQKQMIRRSIGRSAEAIELTAEDLEDRIAPAKLFEPPIDPA